MSKSLARRIQELGDGLPPRLRRAAQWIARQPEAVVLHPLRTLAEQAGVSTSTLLRLARMLGYAGFDALRADALRELQQGDPGFSSKAHAVGRRREAAAGALHGPVLERAAEQAVQRVTHTLAMNSAQALESFAAACLLPRRLFVLGLRSCHALSYSFAYVERFVRPEVVLVQDVGGAPVDVLGEADPQDALCIFSLAPYARDAVELARFAVQRHVPLLAVTDSRSAPYCAWTEQVLLFDSQTPSFFPSQMGGLLLIEQIVLAQVASSGPDVMQRIEQREALLQAIGAYFPGPAPRR
jgi:DNA-binding MurR/RpiR family transcriptional regulator